MSVIQERGSTHVYKVNRISKDEIENMVSLCVYDQPAFCSAACRISPIHCSALPLEVRCQGHACRRGGRGF